MTEALYTKALEALQIMQEIAADHMLPAFGKIDPASIKSKADSSNVTEVDQITEETLIREFTRAFPGDMIFGEESFEADSNKMNLILQDKPVWIIDPLDGTDTFIAGDPGWGMLASYVQDGKPLIGISYDVMRNRTMVTVAGYGVFLNGEKITRQFDAKQISEMVGIAWKRRYKPHLLPIIEQNMQQFREIKKGVPFAECCFLLLDGEIDFIVGNMSNPWDYLPTTMMLRELGGRSGKVIDGHDFSGARLTKTKEASLLVGNASQWDQVRTVLFTGISQEELATGIRTASR